VVLVVGSVLVLILLLTTVGLQVRGFARAVACGYHQSQLMGAMVAYSVDQTMTEAWVVVDPRIPASSTGGNRGRLVTIRFWEHVALNQSLPNRLFTCPSGRSWPPSVKPNPRDPASLWGLEGGRHIGYALDWAAPLDPPSTRPMIADRDPGAHGNVYPDLLRTGSSMVVFGDAHMARMSVTWDHRRGEGALMTEDGEGRSVPGSTGEASRDDIYSTEGDSGDPLTPGKGDPLRAWVK
jgi:hypothetical protein